MFGQESIKVKKQLQFYPKEIFKDSISGDAKPLFYLIVPETLKKSISIFVENGKLDPEKNDSLVSLSYLPGLRYELLYVKENGEKWLPKSLINGTAAIEKKKIRIEVVNRRDDKVVETFTCIVR